MSRFFMPQYACAYFHAAKIQILSCINVEKLTLFNLFIHLRHFFFPVADLIVAITHATYSSFLCGFFGNQPFSTRFFCAKSSPIPQRAEKAKIPRNTER